MYPINETELPGGKLIKHWHRTIHGQPPEKELLTSLPPPVRISLRAA